MEQTTEPIPPVYTVPIPADDGRIGRWIGRLQTKRSVGAVGVVVRNVDPQDLRQMTATNDQQPVQAFGAHVRIQRSAKAFALGACTGVNSTSAPAEQNTSSNPRQNVASRSRMRKRIRRPRSPEHQ